jgi:4-hydroxybenzoate polyprenyltransferase
VEARTVFWWLAVAAFVLAAVVSYSPNLTRHRDPLALLALGLFVAGWAARGATID